jgi:UDP-N-acetylmuramoyl-tripeptide--D-alanyl-D-alanine ligase
MKMMLSDCAKAIQGNLIGEDIAVESVSINTRTIKPGQLYIAIRGQVFDGHQFLAQAVQAGACAAIVEKAFESDLPHIIVKDTRLALAELAGTWRKSFNKESGGPLAVIGVTGSNGKTTVKEMLAAILAINDPVLFTHGNLNNDIGVPLTLLALDEQHRYAVIEMGANHAKEIAYTSHYAEADVVIITNAGAAHIAGFGSLDGVAKAKGEIIETLKKTGTVIINHDDEYFSYWKSVAGNRALLSFGLNAGADVTANKIKEGVHNKAFSTQFELSTNQGLVDITLKLAGRHNVLNALAASAASLALGISLTQIKQGLESIVPVTGRLQSLVSQKGATIIDDTYNANSASLKVALDVLAKFNGKLWVVLGAFGELGSNSPKIHEEMGMLIKSSGVARLMAVGADCKNTVEAFGEGATYFEQQQDLITALKQELGGNETVLIKGSRAQRMETVVAALVDDFRN